MASAAVADVVSKVNHRTKAKLLGGRWILFTDPKQDPTHFTVVDTADVLGSEVPDKNERLETATRKEDKTVKVEGRGIYSVFFFARVSKGKNKLLGGCKVFLFIFPTFPHCHG